MSDVRLPVVITLTAREDLSYNLKKYGARRADQYETFLQEEINQLASEYRLGRLVEDFPQLRSRLMKRSSRGDGHVAVYLVTETVAVVHVFHTKMDIGSRLREELGADESD